MNEFANICCLGLLSATEEVQPVIEKLDERGRLYVYVSLALVVVVGLLLILMTTVGGHWVRRHARSFRMPLKLRKQTPPKRSNRPVKIDSASHESDSIGTAETKLETQSRDTKP